MSIADWFVVGLLAHLVADWFLQNEWQALNKTSLWHPAAWVHSGLHFGCMLFAFPAHVAWVVAVTHLLIDTRVPLIQWRKLVKQTQEGPVMIPFALWQDQAAHLIVLALAAMYLAKAS